MTSMAIAHTENLNTWLSGVKMGSINKTRYQVLRDDREVTAYCIEHHIQCIKGVLGNKVSFASSSVISQLTNAISAQNKYEMEYYNFCRQKTNVKSKMKKQRKKEQRRSTL